VKPLVKIKRLTLTATLPVYATDAAAGADLRADVKDDVVIAPGETVLVHTGLSMEIPDGYVGLICARSGLATKQGLAPANKVGVIDSDYRGEVMVALFNHSGETRTVSHGDRIAQLLIMPVASAVFEEASELENTARGEGGFGSTGKK